jgi:hypothetical protein
MDNLIERILDMDKKLRHLDGKVAQNRETLNNRLREINERKQNGGRQNRPSQRNPDS